MGASRSNGVEHSGEVGWVTSQTPRVALWFASSHWRHSSRVSTRSDSVGGVMWAATLPDDGPRGGFFRDGQPHPW